MGKPLQFSIIIYGIQACIIIFLLTFSVHGRDGYTTQFICQSVYQSVSQLVSHSVTLISKMAASRKLKQASKCCTGHLSPFNVPEFIVSTSSFFQKKLVIFKLYDHKRLLVITL